MMGGNQTNVYASAVGTESNVNDSQQEIVKPVKSWKGYLWDTWDLPRDQRWLLFKVDAFVLTFASVSGFAQITSKFHSSVQKARIFLEEPRPEQHTKCLFKRHGGGFGDVW